MKVRNEHFAMTPAAAKVNLRVIGTALVLIHFIASIAHGKAHAGASVMLSSFGYAYVLVVITVAPLIAAALLYSRWLKWGAWLLTLSMLGSFVFGVWHHFLEASNDNVAAVLGPWHAMFLWTAVVLAIIEFAGIAIGWWMVGATRERIA